MSSIRRGQKPIRFAFAKGGVMRRSHRALVFSACLVLSLPVLAQLPSVGIYFDEQGTQITKSIQVELPDPFLPFHAYVIVFWEAPVGGASYGLHIDPRIELLAATYPAGVQIGDPLDGCGVEVGLSFPGFGFNGNPVLISTLLLQVEETVYDGLICVQPNCHYDDVVVADGVAVIYTACGNCGFLTQVIGVESATWGSVKNLYR
jgi:hypothetical protein